MDTPLEEITRNRRENVKPRFSPISCIITAIARRSSETDIDLHGGEAHDFTEMGNGNDKDINFFDIFINNGRICMGFEADRVEKVQTLA